MQFNPAVFVFVLAGFNIAQASDAKDLAHSAQLDVAESAAVKIDGSEAEIPVADVAAIPVAADHSELPQESEVTASADDMVPMPIATTDALGAGRGREILVEKSASSEAEVPPGDGIITDESTASSDDARDKEEVWAEISEAISGLNEMVGDEMFRDLRRLEDNRMEVRVDVNYWQRVRYQTRVDLKNDISNIWHLYVLQYAGEPSSSVYFIDDQTNKTIDIFSQVQ